MGSNLGNRFENLQEAVDALFDEVGTIVKVSSVYQSPAQGFEGEDFLNCVVWVRSRFTPSKILSKILQIEKQLGRTRNPGGYTSRTIDIDIISIDGLVKETKKLRLPHPGLESRRFVLQPLAEVDSQWEHPISGKHVIRLLSETEDDAPVEKQSKWLRNPKKDYDFAQFNYIAIEGNIGAGKTSLATQISEEFNAKLILERFKDNPFLPKFYEDQQRYAFPLEMSFLADRYQQLLEDIAQYDLFTDCVVADYDAYKSLIFAKITLQEEEYNLYKKLFHLMHKELSRPDIYVYLYQNTERLLQNIKKRGRAYEQSIKASYLRKINDGYLEYIKNQHADNIKIIDISEKDFIKSRKDYLYVLKEIIG